MYPVECGVGFEWFRAFWQDLLLQLGNLCHRFGRVVIRSRDSARRCGHRVCSSTKVAAGKRCSEKDKTWRARGGRYGGCARFSKRLHLQSSRAAVKNLEFWGES
jgi:hypothetical protein